MSEQTPTAEPVCTCFCHKKRGMMHILPCCGPGTGVRKPDAATPTPAPDAEPFGYWVEQKHADPVLLRKPAYIPEPSALRTVTPLFAALPASQPVADVEAETYRQMHDTAKDMGYQSILEALEALATLKQQKWQTQHTSTTNDLAQMGLARDAAEAQVATLTARVETLEWALRPFAKIAYSIITNRPDDEVLADSMAADRLTWGDLRKARAALSPDPAVKPSAEGGAV